MLPVAAFGQQPHYEVLGVGDGLPGGEVFDLEQDELGYIWMATEQGICRYDGYTIESFGMDDGLTGHTVFNFFKQVDGSFWCTTFSKRLFYFHPSECRFHAFRYNHLLEQLPSRLVTNSLAIDLDGTVYITFMAHTGFVSISPEGVFSNQLTKIQPRPQLSHLLRCELSSGQLLPVLNQFNRSYSAPFVKIDTVISNITEISWYKVAFSTDGNAVALSTWNALLTSDGTSGHLISIPRERRTGIGWLDDGNIWSGGRERGLTVFSREGEWVQNILPSASVSDVLIDKDGGMWVSTLNQGVAYVPDRKIRTYYSDGDNRTSSIACTPDGTVWIGYRDGYISHVSNDTVTPFHVPITSRLSYSVYNDRTGKMFYCADLNLFFWNGEHRETIWPNLYFHKLINGPADTVFAVSNYGVLCISDQQIVSLDVGRVNDVSVQDSNWLLATFSGLSRFRLEDSSITPIATPELNYRVDDIDHWNNAVLVATKGGGLVVWTADTLLVINKESGLLSNTTNEVYPENDSTLWVATDAGLNRIIFHSNTNFEFDITGISEAQGLINNYVTGVLVIDSSVWVATWDGVCSFPKSVMHPKRSSRYLQVKSVWVNDAQIPTDSLNGLSHDNNRLQVDFHSVAFRQQDAQNYHYRLRGLESRWNETTQRSITYSSIPPGEYTFELAIIEDGHPIEQVSIPVTIQPPFYASWWFWCLSIVALATVLYWFVRVRIILYNHDLARELLRLALKRFTKGNTSVILKVQGQEIRLDSKSICYVKSSGNYMEVHTEDQNFLVRHKIGEFVELVPDPMEYLRVHRSYFIRLDKVARKSVRSVTVQGIEIPVGASYRDAVRQLPLDSV